MTCIETIPSVLRQLLLDTGLIQGRDEAGGACALLVDLHDPFDSTWALTNQFLLMVIEVCHLRGLLHFSHGMQLPVVNTLDEWGALGISGICARSLDIQVKGSENCLRSTWAGRRNGLVVTLWHPVARQRILATRTQKGRRCRQGSEKFEQGSRTSRRICLDLH